MYDFYNIKMDPEALRQSRRALRDLYEAIPETRGCFEHLDECKAWCCEVQNPQVMFVEFLYMWNHVSHRWRKEDIIQLILAAVKHYLDAKPTKGCIFWDKDNKCCRQHDLRPFNCRTYAQVPEDDFKPRYEALKILYQNDPSADLRPQCNLCTSEKPPTSQDMNQWFAELGLIEQDIGIPRALITDKVGGTYRTCHDHLLLYLGTDSFLLKAIAARKGTEEDKTKFLGELHLKLDEVKDFTKVKL